MSPATPSDTNDARRLSQEIRMAVNSVMGVAGLLASTPLEPEQVEYVKAIRSGAEKALALVEKLRGLTQGEPVKASSLTTWPSREENDASLSQEVTSGSSLLLVEDNLINRRVITRLLEKLGHRVQTASNGLEALETVKRQDFDLVFMDIQMPEMDGLEATQAIRSQIEAGRQPWIVALTAAVLPEDRAACSEAGADDYLCKPVRAEELQDAISRASSGERRAA